MVNIDALTDIDHIYVGISFRFTGIRTIIAAEKTCDWSRQIFVCYSGGKDRPGFMALTELQPYIPCGPCIQG